MNANNRALPQHDFCLIFDLQAQKNPLITGNLLKPIKKSGAIMSRKQRAVITRFKKHCEYEQSLAFSRMNSLSFLDFGGRYGY